MREAQQILSLTGKSDDVAFHQLRLAIVDVRRPVPAFSHRRVG